MKTRALSILIWLIIAQSASAQNQRVVSTGSSIAALSEDTIYILHTGQSNAWGADRELTVNADTLSNELVQVWNHASSTPMWKVARINQRPFRSPDYNDSNGPNFGDNSSYAGSVNHGFYLGRKIARETGKIVRIVTTYGDGKPIDQWHDGTNRAQYLDSILARSAAASIPRYDLIVWNQGESDGAVGTSLEDYRTRLDSIITVIRSQPFASNTTPVVMVGLPQISQGASSASSAMESVLIGHDFNADLWTAYASVEGLVLGDNNIHWDSESLKILGEERIYEAWLSLPYRNQEKNKSIANAFLSQNVLYVDPAGDNNTALRGDPGLPFKEFWTASKFAQKGDLIIVNPGTYNLSDSAQIVGGNTYLIDSDEVYSKSLFTQDSLTYQFQPGTRVNNYSSGTYLFADSTGKTFDILGELEYYIEDNGGFLLSKDEGVSNHSIELKKIIREGVVHSNDKSTIWLFQHTGKLGDYNIKLKELYGDAWNIITMTGDYPSPTNMNIEIDNAIGLDNCYFFRQQMDTLIGDNFLMKINNLQLQDADAGALTWARNDIIKNSTYTLDIGRGNIDIYSRTTTFGLGPGDYGMVDLAMWTDLDTVINSQINIHCGSCVTSQILSYNNYFPNAYVENFEVKFSGNWIYNPIENSTAPLIPAISFDPPDGTRYTLEGNFLSNGGPIAQPRLPELVARGTFEVTTPGTPLFNLISGSSNDTLYLENAVLLNDGVTPPIEANSTRYVYNYDSYSNSNGTDPEVSFLDTHPLQPISSGGDNGLFGGTNQGGQMTVDSVNLAASDNIEFHKNTPDGRFTRIGAGTMYTQVVSGAGDINGLNYGTAYGGDLQFVHDRNSNLSNSVVEFFRRGWTGSTYDITPNGAKMGGIWFTRATGVGVQDRNWMEFNATITDNINGEGYFSWDIEDGDATKNGELFRLTNETSAASPYRLNRMGSGIFGTGTESIVMSGYDANGYSLNNPLIYGFNSTASAAGINLTTNGSGAGSSFIANKIGIVPLSTEEVGSYQFGYNGSPIGGLYGQVTSLTGDINLQIRTGANPASDVALEINENKTLILPGYTSGAKDDTPTKALGLNGSNEVVTFAVPSGGGASYGTDIIQVSDGAGGFRQVDSLAYDPVTGYLGVNTTTAETELEVNNGSGKDWVRILANNEYVPSGTDFTFSQFVARSTDTSGTAFTEAHVSSFPVGYNNSVWGASYLSGATMFGTTGNGGGQGRVILSNINAVDSMGIEMHTGSTGAGYGLRRAKFAEDYITHYEPFRQDQGGDRDFVIDTRDVGLAFPVPYLQPAQDDKVLAFDLFPRGAPADFGDNGITWMDIVDTDAPNAPGGNPAMAALRLGITSTHTEIGSRAFNGADNKPLEITMEGAAAITVDTKRVVTIEERLEIADSVILKGASNRMISDGLLQIDANASGGTSQGRILLSTNTAIPLQIRDIDPNDAGIFSGAAFSFDSQSNFTAAPGTGFLFSVPGANMDIDADTVKLVDLPNQPWVRSNTYVLTSDQNGHLEPSIKGLYSDTTLSVTNDNILSFGTIFADHETTTIESIVNTSASTDNTLLLGTATTAMLGHKIVVTNSDTDTDPASDDYDTALSAISPISLNGTTVSGYMMARGETVTLTIANVGGSPAFVISSSSIRSGNIHTMTAAAPTLQLERGIVLQFNAATQGLTTNTLGTSDLEHGDELQIVIVGANGGNDSTLDLDFGNIVWDNLSGDATETFNQARHSFTATWDDVNELLILNGN